MRNGRRAWAAVSAAFCVICFHSASGGALPGQIDLSSASSVAMHVYGATYSGQSDLLSAKSSSSTGIYSSPTIASGDINGDGYQDIVIGAPYHYAVTAGNQGGGVYVIYGSAASTGQIALSSFSGLKIEGETTGGHLGSAVAVADVDGDGYDDIIVGAPENTDALSSQPLGAVYVIYGGSSLPAEIDLSDLSGLAAGTVSVFRSERLIATSGISGVPGSNPPPTAGRFGAALATGDINGDGIKDILIGAPNLPSINNTQTNCCSSGRAYIAYGTSSRFAADAIINTSSISGATPVDHLGSSLAAGDVNGDGYDDLIIGAPIANSVNSTLSAPGTDRGGAVYIVYGAATSLGGIDLSKSPTNVSAMLGIAAADNLGWTVAAGDVNGDGFADAVVAAPQSPTSGNPGTVYLIHGAATLPATIDLTNADVTVQGGTSIGSLGCSTAVADVNGDGYDDLLLGSPQNGCMTLSSDTSRGTLTVLYGNGAALANSSIDLAASAPDVAITGATVADGAGETATIFGDINGDGYGDLGVGLPFAGTYGSGNGEFDLLAGGGTATSAVRTVMSHTGAAVLDFGTSVRGKIQFADGTNIGASTTTATLYRDNSAIANLVSAGNTLAASYWGITSDRSFTSATVSFHYLNNEVSGINAGSLVLYQATSRSGPWTAVSNSAVDIVHRTVSGTVTALSATPTYFALEGTSAGTAPTVVSTSPANTQQDVDAASSITVTFDKDMDATTINSATFALSNGTHGTVSYDAVTRTATFTPSASLTTGFPYTVVLTTGVTDSNGNALASNYSWSFFTAGVTPLFNVQAAIAGGGGGAVGVGLLLLIVIAVLGGVIVRRKARAALA